MSVAQAYPASVSTLHRIAIAAAVILFLGAVAATLLPTSPQGATCGTWVTPEWQEDEVDEFVESSLDLAERDPTGGGISGEVVGMAAGARAAQRLCDDALGTRRTVTLVLVGLMVAVPVALVFIGAGRRTEDDA